MESTLKFQCQQIDKDAIIGEYDVSSWKQYIIFMTSDHTELRNDHHKTVLRANEIFSVGDYLAIVEDEGIRIYKDSYSSDNIILRHKEKKGSWTIAECSIGLLLQNDKTEKCYLVKDGKLEELALPESVLDNPYDWYGFVNEERNFVRWEDFSIETLSPKEIENFTMGEILVTNSNSTIVNYPEINMVTIYDATTRTERKVLHCSEDEETQIQGSFLCCGNRIFSTKSGKELFACPKSKIFAITQKEDLNYIVHVITSDEDENSEEYNSEEDKNSEDYDSEEGED